MRKAGTRGSPVDDDHPYSQINVTLQIRVLHGQITRSRFTANIYPDPALTRLAKQGLDNEDYGTNEAGEFCLNFSPHWLDLNDRYPTFDEAAGGSEAHRMDVMEMNEMLKKSVDWVLDLHRRAMQSRPTS